MKNDSKKENKILTFFKKLGNNIKVLWKKVITWSKAHLPLAISIGAGALLIIATSIVLPIVLSNSHTNEVDDNQTQQEEPIVDPQDPIVNVVDTTAPVITIPEEVLAAGAAGVYVDEYAMYFLVVALTVRAEDDVDGALGSDSVTTDFGDLDLNNPEVGSYNITLTYTDSAGNSSSAVIVLNLIERVLTMEQLLENCVEDTFIGNLSMTINSKLSDYQGNFLVEYQSIEDDESNTYYAYFENASATPNEKTTYYYNSEEEYSFAYTICGNEATVNECTLSEMQGKTRDYSKTFIEDLIEEYADDFEYNESGEYYEATSIKQNETYFVRIKFKGKTAVMDKFEYGHGSTVDFRVSFSLVGTTSVTIPTRLVDKYNYSIIIKEMFDTSYKSLKVESETSIQKYDFEHKVASFGPSSGNANLTQYWVIDKGLVLALDYDDSKANKWIPTAKTYEPTYFEYKSFIQDIVPTNLINLQITSMDYLTNTFVVKADSIKAGNRDYTNFELSVKNGKVAKLKGQYNNIDVNYNFSSYDSITLNVPSYNLSNTILPSEFFLALKVDVNNSNMIISDSSDSSNNGVYNWRTNDNYKSVAITPINQNQNKIYIFRIDPSEYKFTTDKDGKLIDYTTKNPSYNSMLNEVKNAINEIKSNGKLCTYDTSSKRFVNGDYEFTFDNGKLVYLKTPNKAYLISYTDLKDIEVPSSVATILDTVIQ